MSTNLATIDGFKQQIASAGVQDNLKEFMPAKALAKFTAVTIRAVQENPDLLDADRKTLFIACQRAAQDGLMPDSREGALVIYNTKSGDKWIKKVQWQPMILGIRKKMTQAGWDIRAEIRYEKDTFNYVLGDSPSILHEPFLSGDRGKIIGAYAIATEHATGEKYREYMDIGELDKVRNSSKQKDGAIWTTWASEMYRKTVAKRLRKSLPIQDDTLLDLIDRDNDQFTSEPQVSSKAREVQEAMRAGIDTHDPEPEQEVIEGELVDTGEPEPNSDPLDF